MKKIFIILAILLMITIVCFGANWNVSDNASFYEDSNDSIFGDTISSLASSLGKTRRYYSTRLTIKDAEEPFDARYNTIKPGSGAFFCGSEIYAIKAEDNDGGEILFVARNSQTIDLVYPNIDYSIFGNLYEPNLCNSSDEGTLILTCHTVDSKGKYSSVVMTLNYDFDVTSYAIIPNIKLIGNSVFTEQGNLLHLGYDKGLNIYKSTEVINKDVSSLKLKKVATLDSNSKIKYATIGRFNDMLVAFFTSDKEVVYYMVSNSVDNPTKWSSYKQVGDKFIYPVLLSQYEGDSLLIGGTAIDTNGSYPFIGKFDVNKGSLVNQYCFDNKPLGPAGYTTIVNHNDGYGILYYENIDTEECAIYLKDVKTNFEEMIPTESSITNNELEKLLNSFPYSSGVAIGNASSSNLSFDYDKNNKMLALRYGYQNYSTYNFNLNNSNDSFSISLDDLEEFKTLTKLCGVQFEFKNNDIIFNFNNKNYVYTIKSKDDLFSRNDVENFLAFVLNQTYKNTDISEIEGCNSSDQSKKGKIYLGYKKESVLALKPLIITDGTSVKKVVYKIDNNAEIETDNLKNIKLPRDGQTHIITLTAFGSNGENVQTKCEYK